MISSFGDKAKEHILAEPDSLLGQLQRGRGMGFLRALQERPAVSEPLLFDCVIHDPRWDRQLESRGAYYAALLLQLALPLAPFEAYLRVCSEDDSEEAGDAEYVVLNTLLNLAARGDTSAIAIVHTYLTYGRHWDDAFETLMEISGSPLRVEEMSYILDQRFPDDDELDDELFTTGPATYTQQGLWKALREVNPRVERVLTTNEQEKEQAQRRQEREQERLARLPTSEFLALETIDESIIFYAARALQQHVTDADLDLLLQMAQDGEYWQRALAFHGLRRLAHPAALPILQAFFESPAAQPGSLYAAAAHAIVALPPTVTLDLARAWFDEPAGQQRHVALRILKAHATVADAERIHADLLPSLKRDRWGTSECYQQGSLLKILTRFPEARFYTAIETMFKEANYARTRIYAAQALAACDQQRFAHGTALECLWDCEDDVRLVGTSCVALPGSDATERLQIMASDPHEYAKVRQAAEERLKTTREL